MTLWSYVLASLRHHARTGLAVLLGVAAATAVFTGALVVGDSVRGSLRELALDRLGQIDSLLIVDRFFRSELREDVEAKSGRRVVGAITLPAATVERPGDEPQRAANVLVLGIEDSYWELSAPDVRPAQPLERGQIVINEELARELGAKAGDELIVRLAKASQIPADSPLGRKTDRIQALAELKIIAILPTRSLGRFSLQPTQSFPRVAYVALADLQSALDQADKLNTLLAAQSKQDDAKAKLDDAVPLRLEDLGLRIKHVERKFKHDGKEEAILDYYQLTSDRMVIEPAAADAALAAWKGLHPHASLTYLANAIRKVNGESAGDGKPNEIPYSMVTAIDAFDGGPLSDAEGNPLPELKPGAIALNRWAAEDLEAKPGDKIELRYFEPETTHGEEKEVSAQFEMQAIVPLTEPVAAYNRKEPAQFGERPTFANDPDLTPEVPGITDQDSMANWDAPFPFDNKRLRSRDDTYWENYRTTPKAFVSLATGQKLWQSRFGQVTAIRVAARDGVNEQTLGERLLAELEQRHERLGMEFRPIRSESIAASQGTTPFDALFLALSMFLIAAALMLVWLLFRLGIERRASEIGTLLAFGWKRSRIGRAFLLEGLLQSVAGGIVGVIVGVGYAWLMIYGLKTWWIGAISSPFLDLIVTPFSLILGFAIGLVASLATIWGSLRMLRKVAVRSLMSGRTIDAASGATRNSQWGTIAAGALFLLAAGLAVYATQLGGEAQAGAFLGAGACLLVAILIFVRRLLIGEGGSLVTSGGLTRFALRNAGRNSTRSLLSMGLTAAAAFLIVAVSAFRLAPSESGSGGAQLVAESSEPILHDLNSEKGRTTLLGDKAMELAGSDVFPFRVRPGDDASCRNLYRSTQPRILGVSPTLINHFDQPRPHPFRWAGSAANTPAERDNPWALLAEEHPAEPIPVVIDKNTAMYSLQLYGGVGEEFEVDLGEQNPLKLKVAGLLENSVLQGSLLMGEADFRRLFPEISGYRYFLVQTPSGEEKPVASLLESQLGDQGFDVTPARDILRDLLAVQNTYISTFQSLGGLGLLLGMFGLAAVQMRNIAERRGELALLRAVGYAQTRLGRLVMLENLVLLLGGLATGVVAALFAVLPHMFVGGAQPPLFDLAIMLGLVLLVGIAVGSIAIRSALKADLLPALRGE